MRIVEVLVPATAGGTSIYWTPQTGPHEVHGAIRDLWAGMGWENSFLHYPTSDETGSDSQRVSHFQGGHIFTWSPAQGASAQRGGRIDDSQ